MGTGRVFRRLGIPVFLLFLAASAAGQSSCATANGLYLATSGGRLGDPWYTGLYGTPGASGLLAADVASGPVSTPLGPVCLGFTPSLQLHPFTLDGTGHWSAGGILPPKPATSGLTVYLQAAALDATQPTGFAVSNGSMVTLRPPRAFITYSGGGSPSFDSSFCVYDGLTETVTAPVTVPGMTLKAVMIPNLSWLAFLTTPGSGPYYVLRCYDANTGASTLTQQIPAGGGAGVANLAVEGTTLYVVDRGWFLGGSTPGRLRSFSLPSCAPGFNCVLPPGLDPDDLMILPGQGIAYVQLGTTVVPVNLVTGALLPTINFGVTPQGPASAPFNGISEWVRAGTVVYCLFPGFGPSFFPGLIPTSPYIGAIDTLTHTALSSSPVPINPPYGPAPRLRYGPGTNGNALFVWGGSPLMLRQLDPVSLSTTGSTAIAGTLFDLAISPGGTEWLIVAGYPFSIQSMNPQTLAVTTVTPYPAYNAFLSPIPNATIRRAFTVDEFGQLHPFGTDPSAAPIDVGVPLTIPGVTSVIVD